MSVLLEFAMFPTSKEGSSSSPYVSKIIDNIRKSGVSYKLTPMGTIIETETISQALKIVEDSYAILEPFADRVYTTLTMDIRKGKNNRMVQKIESIENKIGKVNT